MPKSQSRYRVSASLDSFGNTLGNSLARAETGGGDRAGRTGGSGSGSSISAAQRGLNDINGIQLGGINNAPRAEAFEDSVTVNIVEQSAKNNTENVLSGIVNLGSAGFVNGFDRARNAPLLTLNNFRSSEPTITQRLFAGQDIASRFGRRSSSLGIEGDFSLLQSFTGSNELESGALGNVFIAPISFIADGIAGITEGIANDVRDTGFFGRQTLQIGAGIAGEVLLERTIGRFVPDDFFGRTREFFSDSIDSLQNRFFGSTGNANSVSNLSDADLALINADRAEAASNIRQARTILREANVPLSAQHEIIRSFDLESFRVNTLTQETELFRFFDDAGKATLSGRFATSDLFENQTDRITKLALPSNAATRAGVATIPSGTTIFTGRVAPQPLFDAGLIGGGNQTFITGALDNIQFKEISIQSLLEGQR